MWFFPVWPDAMQQPRVCDDPKVLVLMRGVLSIILAVIIANVHQLEIRSSPSIYQSL